MFNSDCAERAVRAFVGGVITAATSLHIFANGHFDITDLAHYWQPLLVGGVFGLVTMLKAQVGLGRGEDPESGSWKGITNNDA